MKREDGRGRPWACAGGAALAGAVCLIWAARAQGQQPTSPRPGDPSIHATVKTEPNADGSYHVEYQLARPAAGIQFLAHPRVRVVNAKGEMVALLPLRVLPSGVLLVGYGDYRIPRTEHGRLQVYVEQPFARADGSRAAAADLHSLDQP